MATNAVREALVTEADMHFSLAYKLLAPVPARLIAIGGLSGTGKSTLSAAIADRIGLPPGARVFSSDRIRKRLYGRAASTRADTVGLGRRDRLDDGGLHEVEEGAPAAGGRWRDG